jgi:hypothetical protein
MGETDHPQGMKKIMETVVKDTNFFFNPLAYTAGCETV